MSLFTCQRHGLHHGPFCPVCGEGGEFVSFTPPSEKPRDGLVEWPADFGKGRGK